MKSAEKNEIFSKEEWKILVNELSLPPRQSEIIQHLFSGQSDKQIAGKLGIAIPTVRTHLGRLFLKFNLQDRNQLVLYVLRRFRDKCKNGNGCPRWLALHA